MLLEVFIINRSNSLLMLKRSFTKKELAMDGQIFSGLITTISSFISEMKFGEIKHLEVGNIRILISIYEGIFVVGLVEEQHEDEFISNSLKIIAEKFWDKYKDSVINWNGNLVLYTSFESQIDDLVYGEFTKQYISKDFPKHIISVTRQFQNKFEPQVMKFIGKKAGITRGTPSNDLLIVKKKLQKEINLFSISEIKEAGKSSLQVEILMCPICRGIRDHEFSCSFIEGFIEGFVFSSFPTKIVSTTETKCIAHGDSKCQFDIEIKEFSLDNIRKKNELF